MKETLKNQRKYALAVSGGFCEVCGKPLNEGELQGAHRIGNTKANRSKYGDFVINHRLNLGMTCSLKCNGALDISKNTGEVIQLCKKIYEAELKKYEVGK